MNLKVLLSSTKKSPLVKLYLRLFPTLIGLSVISAFLLTQPKLAHDLTNQLLVRLNLKEPQIPTYDLDLVAPLNQFRKENNLNAFVINDNLNQIAKLATLTIANNPDDEDPIDLKQFAFINNYSYSNIAYLAAINPLPLVTPPTSLWISDSKEELLSTNFSQIGSHYLKAQIDNQDQLVTVVVLGHPQNSPTLVKTSSFYTGVTLWEELQKYRVEHGVPPFKQDNTLCTIASIRVNQLIELNKLDNHDGFAPLVKKFQEEGTLTHSNVAENILSGYPTAQEAVKAWDGSLGHQALMRDGAYTFGCAAANHGYAALVAAY